MNKVHAYIRDIFSTFHDGVIADYEGDLNKLSLTIQCNYLAELIKPDFENFFLDLIGINKLDFEPWMDTTDMEKTDFHKHETFLKVDLEILSAELKDNIVLITCNQHDTDSDYCGGEISLSVDDFNLFDHNRRQMTIEQLDSISRNYWDKFRK